MVFRARRFRHNRPCARLLPPPPAFRRALGRWRILAFPCWHSSERGELIAEHLSLLGQPALLSLLEQPELVSRSVAIASSFFLVCSFWIYLAIAESGNLRNETLPESVSRARFSNRSSDGQNKEGIELEGTTAGDVEADNIN